MIIPQLWLHFSCTISAAADFERDQGQRLGLMNDEQARFKALAHEVRELRLVREGWRVAPWGG
ncbi:hypothetical protein [Photorhabdus laumondii]|uniref:hypothetical protein n=1 Tax=Photorhabdus laumondii TaxID=2218628 RepID=UPI0011BF20D1|nr:hypothetical protein [Photorhabdus laumondii]